MNIEFAARFRVHQTGKVSEVLKSLVPKDQEELSILQLVVDCAQSLQRASLMDLRLGRDIAAANQESSRGMPLEAKSLLEQIPQECTRYLHGLVEALDIYQTIYGHSLQGQSLTLADKTVYELRQIRDMCLEEGLRSIY